jgi:hypothetical protein
VAGGSLIDRGRNLLIGIVVGVVSTLRDNDRVNDAATRHLLVMLVLSSVSSQATLSN